MSEPAQRARLPVVPVLLALALAASNWLVHALSFTPGQMSGNGFHPVQFLMTMVSMGLAVVLLVFVFRYVDRVAPRLTDRARWLAVLALLVGGAGLLVWAWFSFREYETTLYFFRAGDRWRLFNQYTVRFWAADLPFWAGLLSLAGSGGLLRGRVHGVVLMVPLVLAFVLPAVLVPFGYRIDSRGALVMLRPVRPVALVQPGAGRPSVYIVQLYSSQLLVLGARDPGSGCTLIFNQAEQRFHDPCKGAEYGPDGRALAGAANRSLARYPVRMEGNRLYIDLAGPPQPGAAAQ
jgi:hypothetical protein